MKRSKLIAYGIGIAMWGMTSPAQIVNGGFESNFAGWTAAGLTTISTSHVHAGFRSAEITGASGRIHQTVPVVPNTEHVLRAWVCGSGRVGVDVGAQTYHHGGTFATFALVPVRFNSGASTQVTVFAEWFGATGRFDDFYLVASAGGGKHTGLLPSAILSLQNWKLTLPFDQFGNDGLTPHPPAEVLQPDLARYEHPESFVTNGAASGVIFRAHAGGVTTGNSQFSRSELREMTNGGATKASWSSSVGRHTMFIRQSINRLPPRKPHVVVGQIHDRSDDVAVFRLEGDKCNGKLCLYVTDFSGSKITPPIDSDYRLGTPFDVAFVVENDRTDMYYNGRLVRSAMKSYSGAYFKAGCYVQSNCFGRPSPPFEACDAFAEVEIFELWVSHQ